MKMKDIVLQKLRAIPLLRQNKRYLQAHIWLEQCRAENITTIEEFVIAYSQKKLANAETIRRSCMILMNQHPELKPSKEITEQNQQMEALMRAHRGDL
jgi:hypothetical protein